MVVDLTAARVGLRPASGRAARDDGPRVPGVLALVDGRSGMALKRGWRVAMAAALGQLPSGACLTIRDSDGREWYVGPAAPAKAASFRKAV